MLKLPKDLREFIELLNSHSVRYLIVGGYAVAYHGYPRTTGDIDFFLEVSEENARKLEAVLVDFGFGGLGLTSSDFLQPGVIIQLGYPPNRIDLITAITGVEFADAWDRRIAEEIGGVIMTLRISTTIASRSSTRRVGSCSSSGSRGRWTRPSSQAAEQGRPATTCTGPPALPWTARAGGSTWRTGAGSGSRSFPQRAGGSVRWLKASGRGGWPSTRRARFTLAIRCCRGCGSCPPKGSRAGSWAGKKARCSGPACWQLLGDGSTSPIARQTRWSSSIGAAGGSFLASAVGRFATRTASAWTGPAGSGSRTPRITAWQSELLFPTTLALGPDGSVYVVDAGNRRVKRFGRRGRLISQSPALADAFLTRISVGGDGTVYLAGDRLRLLREQPDGAVPHGQAVHSGAACQGVNR